MEEILVRIGSFTAQSPALPGSPRVSLSAGASLRVLVQLENRRGGSQIRRAISESDVMRLELGLAGASTRLSGAGSRSLAARIPEEEEELGGWPGAGIALGSPAVEGSGEGIIPAGEIKGKGGEGMTKMREYYERMIKSNPGDSLLLRNYGQFLHEVEGDVERAEECYGRAILASPGDGEVLSLYGKLIWDSHRDGDRAKSFFDQAVLASPDDCSVMGSYAHFMWEAEVEDKAVALVAAF